MIKPIKIIAINLIFLSLFKTIETHAQIYTPPQKVAHITDSLIEGSGLQFVNNSLWSFNDSGNDSAIFRIDTTSNKLFQTVYLEGATNVDWEDIAFDGTYMYIGDFGNNYNGARSDLKIYKFPYSAIPDYATHPIATISASQIETILFSYADQPLPLTPTALPNTTKYDCEAMLIDNGQIHLFSKNWVDLTTTHYIINSLFPGTYIVDSIETLNTGYLVTAADKAPNTNTILLLGYQTSGLGNHFIHKLTNYNSGKYFNGTVQQINLPNAGTMGQAEGLTFRSDKYGYISNEKLQRTVFGIPITINQMLRSFNTDAFPAQTVLPLQLLLFQAVNTNNNIKINWDFDTPVKQLQLQKSIGNTNSFVTFKNYDSSKTDMYYDQVNTPNIYYRLVWSNGNGGYLYSKILNATSNALNSFNNFHLKQNGILNVNLNGNETNYAIQLIDVNGKIIYQIPEKSYMIGNNIIHVPNSSLLVNELVFISLVNKSSSTIKKLLVE